MLKLINIDEDTKWALISAGAAAGAGYLVKMGLEAGWRSVMKKDPPKNPAHPGTGWREALLWTAATGMAMGLAHLIARKAAAESWRAVAGDYPDQLE